MSSMKIYLLQKIEILLGYYKWVVEMYLDGLVLKKQ